jgi:hypothetical protein
MTDHSPGRQYERCRGQKLRLIVAVSAAAVAGSLATTGIAGAVTTRVGATTHDAIRRNLTPITLSSVGGVRMTVESVSLPPGQWVLSSKESIVNFGPTDYVRCGLVGTADINFATSVVGDPSQPGSVGPGAMVATVANFGSVSSRQPMTISVQCDHDTSTPVGGSPPYIDADSVLWAHKSGSIDNMGE